MSEGRKEVGEGVGGWEGINVLCYIDIVYNLQERERSMDQEKYCVCTKKKGLKWAPGFEPGTSRFAVECSTTELCSRMLYH